MRNREAICYLPEEVYELFELYESEKRQAAGGLHVKVENMDTLEMAEKMYHEQKDERIAVLNFANPFTPGGGVKRGAAAQEETLCLRSSLLESLESDEASYFYEYHRKSKKMAASDSIILSPDIEVIKDKEYQPLEEPFFVSVISSAAPLVSPFSHRLEDTSQEQMELLLYRRILCILITLIVHKYRRVVLGAWGCGVFSNDPNTVANMFRKVFNDIEVEKYFDEINFAVLESNDDENYRIFKTILEI